MAESADGRSASNSAAENRFADATEEDAGADPVFQVRGTQIKKIAPSGGRRENFWGISCEKSRFYAKKSYFFQF